MFYGGGGTQAVRRIWRGLLYPVAQTPNNMATDADVNRKARVLIKECGMLVNERGPVNGDYAIILKKIKEVNCINACSRSAWRPADFLLITLLLAEQDGRGDQSCIEHPCNREASSGGP